MLEKKYEDLQIKAVAENRQYEILIKSQPVKAGQIQNSLSDTSTLLISYQVTEDALYIFAISKRDFKLIRISENHESLKDKLGIF